MSELPTLPINTKLVQDTKALTQKLNIPWGKLVALALNDFVRRYNRSQRLTEQINAAYTDNLDHHEMAVLTGMAPTHRRLVECDLALVRQKGDRT